jgi:hypothetical protein
MTFDKNGPIVKKGNNAFNIRITLVANPYRFSNQFDDNFKIIKVCILNQYNILRSAKNGLLWLI